VTKRARKGKGKIRTWAQMRDKLKAKFLPTHYLHDNNLKFHNLKQGTKSVEEYTREFEQLLLKYDLTEDESQTLVRYLSGLMIKLPMLLSYIRTPLSMSLVPLHTKLNKGKGIVSKPPPPRSYPFQRPPNTTPRPQPPHLYGQIPQMLKTHLKETLPNQKIEGGVFGVKD